MEGRTHFVRGKTEDYPAYRPREISSARPGGRCCLTNTKSSPIKSKRNYCCKEACCIGNLVRCSAVHTVDSPELCQLGLLKGTGQAR